MITRNLEIYKCTKCGRDINNEFGLCDICKTSSKNKLDTLFCRVCGRETINRNECCDICSIRFNYDI
ncbi:MAG: hypothetical protein IJ593_02835 [Lachnospiraceae bacterium]|nr:hypothetical protein [Lachnospiraceae bacterium]